ncbi:helix-turn-helix transcriptional regulator [Anaerotardibacter muris]|uniref:helix-turn-helix transcriptional regulator n=1 Tax=Anaerotardibacter muris TaxID=2941505 RepID=UPI0020404FB0|nr:helix-turn-helix domain-containing protein [Anaerotardibacter muris]
MNVEIAQRLAMRRKHAGLSQEALAEKLGVSRQAVSKWERSESSPDTDNLIALAQLYNVSLDDLLYAEVSSTTETEAASRSEESAIEPDPKTTNEDDTESAAEPSDETNDEPTSAPTDQPASEPAGEHSVKGEPTDDSSSSRTYAPGFNFGKEGKGNVHIGFDGIHVEDGRDSVHVSWAEGVHVVDSSGEEVHVDWDGVRINSEQGPTSDQVFKRGRRHHHHNYGSGPLTPFARNWLRFPFWALVIIAYLLAGVIKGFWLPGLFFFLTIPLYYALGPAIEHKRIAPFLGVLYPILTIGWFCWMAFIENQPHPAWAIFLTIPVVEVCIVAFSKWWRHRKR